MLYKTVGRWYGEVDEPIAHRRSYADAERVARDSLRGVYPGIGHGDMTGEPTFEAYVVDCETDTVVDRFTV